MNFDKAFELVIGHEGGYVNDPDDRGGETKYGISKRAYPHVDIKNLTLEGAKRIYLTDYWMRSKCNLLHDDIRYIHFDTAVNMGVPTAARILQEASGLVGNEVDGIIGPITLQASEDCNILYYAFKRLIKYCHYVSNIPTNTKFIKGWANRVEDVLEKSKADLA